MNLIDKDYISIKWLQKTLVDLLYDRKINHEVMDVFIKIIAKWRRENEK